MQKVARRRAPQKTVNHRSRLGVLPTLMAQGAAHRTLVRRAARACGTGGIVIALLFGCAKTNATAEGCSGYDEPSGAIYLLPFAPGARYPVSQGNCSTGADGHQGSERYAYDFDLPIGTEVLAMRSGTVVHTEAAHHDGEIASKGFDNYVVIRHSDGTHGLYAHLTHDGALCEVGQHVEQGQAIARSGNTGNTNNWPHLHVAMHSCDPVVNGSDDCPTWAITFRNAQPSARVLKRGQSYAAAPTPPQ